MDSVNITHNTQIRYQVYAMYAYAHRQKGDVISTHKTYDAANKVANKSSFWGIREVYVQTW